MKSRIFTENFIHLTDNRYLVPGDCIKLYFSLDGTTWQEVERYETKKNYLDLEVLTLADLKMFKYNDSCPGLYVQDGNSINTNGTTFNVIVGNIYNYTKAIFEGEVAIYLCDSNNNPKQMIGSRDYSKIGVNAFYPDYAISCKIESADDLRPNDRLVAFCRQIGRDDWSIIYCDEPEKYYITIPKELIPSTQTVNFSGLFSTYCSGYDLDFSGINNYHAYTLTMQDSETLILTRIDHIPAGVGVLLMGENGNVEYTGTATILADTPAYPDGNLLVGVLENTVVDNDDKDIGTNYVFQTTPETGFYIAKGETVAAGSAFMRIKGAAVNAPARFMFMGGGQSGVFSVTADAYTDSTIYNLQGMKVTKPGRGIYIIGGKKVIIR